MLSAPSNFSILPWMQKFPWEENVVKFTQGAAQLLLEKTRTLTSRMAQ